jgi:hypothetical protein
MCLLIRSFPRSALTVILFAFFLTIVSPFLFDG